MEIMDYKVVFQDGAAEFGMPHSINHDEDTFRLLRRNDVGFLNGPYGKLIKFSDIVGVYKREENKRNPEVPRYSTDNEVIKWKRIAKCR